MAQDAGIVLKKMAFMSVSMFSVIVNSPLKANSISCKELTMTLMRMFITSHSCKNEFW